MLHASFGRVRPVQLDGDDLARKAVDALSAQLPLPRSGRTVEGGGPGKRRFNAGLRPAAERAERNRPDGTGRDGTISGADRPARPSGCPRISRPGQTLDATTEPVPVPGFS